MSAFRDMLNADLRNVFLCTDEFAERRTIMYSGEIYTDIPVVITKRGMEDRGAKADDYAQGLYKSVLTVHCARSDLGGRLPEQGQRIRISTTEGGEYFRTYYIAESQSEMGMVHLTLEAIDE